MSNLSKMSTKEIYKDFGIKKNQFEACIKHYKWTPEQVKDNEFIYDQLDECYSMRGWPWDNEPEATIEIELMEIYTTEITEYKLDFVKAKASCNGNYDITVKGNLSNLQLWLDHVGAQDELEFYQV